MSIPTEMLRLTLAKSTSQRMDIVRGTKDHAGLLERHHNALWAVPRKDHALSFVCNDIPFSNLDATAARVLLAIVGHTWNFAKGSEFITYAHLLYGKRETFDNLPLVGPANVSKGSLGKAFETLVQQGFLYRFPIQFGMDKHILYAPNSMAAGRAHPGRSVEPSAHSAGSPAQLIHEMVQPVIGIDKKPVVFDLFPKLVDRLRRPELIRLLVERFSDQLKNDLAARRAAHKALIKISEATPKNIDLVTNLFHEVNEQERAWLEDEEVEEYLSRLVELRDSPNSSKPDMLSTMASFHRWGPSMLSLSSDAWGALAEDRKHLTSNAVAVMQEIRAHCIERNWPVKLAEV